MIRALPGERNQSHDCPLKDISSPTQCANFFPWSEQIYTLADQIKGKRIIFW